MKQANDAYTRDLIDKPKRGRPRKVDALSQAERAAKYRARKRSLTAPIERATMVAALFVREDSHYKTMRGVDAWDATRDARSWPGGVPLVAHPPCRAWGRLRGFAKPRPDEKDLARFAVANVRKWGGVLEHPQASTLWIDQGLPRPGTGFDQFGGWTLQVPQYWFGHQAEKMTWLYIVGCPDIPAIPVRVGRPPMVVCNSLPPGHPKHRPGMHTPQRERTPADFAIWLVELARRCRVHGA